jgi:hypothetical protein
MAMVLESRAGERRVRASGFDWQQMASFSGRLNEIRPHF